MNTLRKAYNKIYRHFFPPQKTEFERTVDQYNAAGGDKHYRFNYPLTPDSIVFDVGGFEGQWASDLFAMYQPVIHLFEPVHTFADGITKRFAHNKKILVHPFGLSDTTTTTSIAVIDNKSSVFLSDENSERVDLVQISEFIQKNNISHIDLMKINIEGGEYPLLEDLIAHGLVSRVENIQVQFHSFVPDATARMNAIKKDLTATHTLTYSFPFVWENWKRNDTTHD
jgi:FkbM family methyltransferase